jgi:outer membrane immunogenic protein
MKPLLLASISVIALGCAAASAADIPVRAPVAKAPPVAALFNWSGFYVGGTVGYGFGDTYQVDDSLTARSPGFDWDGAVAGGTIGVNWQSGNWVLGLEADLSWSGIGGALPDGSGWGCNSLACHNEVEWFGTARVRVGPTFDRFFPYVTGGFAYGRLYADYGLCPSCTRWSETGWTLGAGGEWSFAPNWSAKAEYLYVNLGTTATVPDPGLNAKFHLVRFGVNYLFASGGMRN